MRSVGELLKKARENKNFSLNDVSKLTKIRIAYLKAIENSDYEALPAPVFTKGFIRNYAEFLGLDAREVLAFFRREFDERKSKDKHSLEPPQPLRKTLEILTPSTLIMGVVGLLVFVFLGYLFVQYRSYSKAPELIIEKPTDRIQQTLSYTEVVGKTDEDAIVKVNGQTIRTTGNGNFSVTVDLAEGENKIQISAVNPLGKETVEIRTVYFLVEEPVSNDQNQQSPTNNEGEKVVEGIEVEVLVGPNAAWLKVETDGKETFEGILNPGVKRLFTAKEGLKIRTGNGGSTMIKFNGKEEGPMGGEGTPVEKEYRK